MEITVNGNIITPSEPGDLYRNRVKIADGPGPFTVAEDGVYFVEDTPCLVVAEAESSRSALWKSFLDSEYRYDIRPYTDVNRTIQAAKVLFAKNDFYGADKKINSWK